LTTPRPGRPIIGKGILLILLAVLLVRLFVHPPRLTEPFLVSHRGAAGLAPENTIAAIQAALAHPVATIEIDVRRTADGAIVLMHDRAIRRTVGGAGRVDRLDLETLQDAARARGRAPIPTLDEALAAVKGSGAFLMIEVKEPARAPGIAEQVVAAIERATMAEQVVVASTDLDWLHGLHGLAPDLKLTAVAPAALGLFREGEIRQVSVHWLSVVLDPSLVWRLHEQGCAVLAWTVDKPWLARWLWENGVDGIVTDRPDLLGDTLAQLDDR
jgi:glycerophosphoryl diester phosphodiesterase